MGAGGNPSRGRIGAERPPISKTAVLAKSGRAQHPERYPALARYDRARRALAEAHSVDEVKSIRSKAVAIQAYARQAGDYGMQNMAAEIRLRAERRAGELLREMEKNPGGQPAHKGPTGLPKAPVGRPTLKELRISKKQSSTWQSLAAAPEGEFTCAIACVKNRGELTTAAVLRDIRARIGPWPERKEPDAQERIWRVQDYITRLYAYVPMPRWYEEVSHLLDTLVADFNRYARYCGLPGWHEGTSGVAIAAVSEAGDASQF